MTREEAISVLKETIDTNVDKSFKEWREWDKEKHLPAVNMAIEALTYQNLSKPINTCEVDLISRKDAMGAVQDHFSAGGFKGYYDGQKMMDRITALPSAEAVQGVGRYEKAMEILREMPRRLSGIIEKQIKQSRRLIDADALHRSIDTETYRHTYIEQTHEIIDDAPTIDAVPVKYGEWINTASPDSDNIFCDQCGYDSIVRYDFCPNCGAKMKGQDED